MGENTYAVNKVLLVDDNDTDNFINRRIIELTKFAKEIEVRNSGKSALEYFEKMLNDMENLPNLVFLDINMPIVDGFVFLYEMESFPQELRNRVKIAVLTSSDNKRDMDQILSNEHVIKFITKPLTSEELLKIRSMINSEA
jgi:CheY-like chemotaxis protein